MSLHDKLLRWPIYVAAGIVPWIVRIKVVSLGDEKPEYFQEWTRNIDFFAWWKSMLIIGCGLTALIGIILAWVRRKDKPDPRVLGLGLLFLVLLWASCFASPYLVTNLWGFANQYQGAFVWSSYLILLFAASLAFKEPEDLRRLGGAFCTMIFIVSVIGLLQFFGFGPLNRTPLQNLILNEEGLQSKVQLMYDGLGQISSTLYNPNYVGSFVSLILPLTLMAFINAPKKIELALLGLLNALVFAMGLASGSRAGFFPALLASVTLIVFSRRRLLKDPKPILGLLVVYAFLIKAVFAVPHSNTEKYSEPWIPRKSPTTPIHEKKVHGSGVATGEAEQAPVEFDPAWPYGGVQLSVQNGRVFFSYQDKPVRLEVTQTALSIRDGYGKPIEVETKGGTVTFQRPGYEGYSIGLVPDKQHRLFFDLYWPYGEPLRFAVTEQGLKLVVWGTIVDSENPAIWPKLLPPTLFSNRGYIWSRTLPLLSETLLLGAGPGSYSYYFPQRDFSGKLPLGISARTVIDKPHSFYLQVAHGSGVVSLLALCSLFVLVLLRLLEFAAKERNPWYLAAFLGLLSYLLSSLFYDSTVCVAPLFWVLLGVCIGNTGSQARLIIDSG